jgi:hypothetical protein
MHDIVSFKTTIGYRHDLSFKVEVEGTREEGVVAVYALEEDGRDIFEHLSDRAVQQLEEELIAEIADQIGCEVERLYDAIRDERLLRGTDL